MRLEVAALGRVDYAHTTALQEALVGRRLEGGDDVLLLLEHTPVYTLGRGADARHLGAAATGNVAIVRASRGGQVTYHGPGQLVGYPVIDLRAHRPDVRWYVRMLEQVLIDACAELGVAAGVRDGLTGVWAGRRKIASIGVAIRRWVTWHGFALNVGPDLAGFSAITPCGIAGVEMTSIADQGGPADLATALPVVRACFVRRFGYAGWQAFEPVGRAVEVAP